MYRIKISYLTGDSFGTQDTYDYLELTWKNLDIAKENLQRIKEHYELYEAVDSYRTNKPKLCYFEHLQEADNSDIKIKFN